LAGPYTTPIPGVAGYAGAAALAEQAYRNAMARYQQQRSNTLLKYGYTKDASGNLQVDANNEYGQYQQMLRNESSQSKGLERAQLASGWGGSSGYLGANRENLNYAQGGEQAALGQGLQGELFDVAQGEQDAAYQKNAALYQAQENAAQTAIQQRLFDPADYSNLPTSPLDPYAKASAKPAAKGTVQWGGKRMNAAQLRSWLRSRGGNLNQWAKNHPGAARALGIK